MIFSVFFYYFPSVVMPAQAGMTYIDILGDNKHALISQINSNQP